MFAVIEGTANVASTATWLGQACVIFLFLGLFMAIVNGTVIALTYFDREEVQVGAGLAITCLVASGILYLADHLWIGWH